ncbi:Myb-like DNA-binding domain protein [Ceratocystis platani]|uniref:Myb-like DNA-binding domain protein n=1 Tax=Ceratocystis fimbriata f. sp. platani TaxID=88771 RepID=A0A0F8D7H5_CERFI|nr:Myb-like DNA-binding domain protein [Ceratocystis platani]
MSMNQPHLHITTSNSINSNSSSSSSNISRHQTRNITSHNIIMLTSSTNSISSTDRRFTTLLHTQSQVMMDPSQLAPRHMAHPHSYGTGMFPSLGPGPTHSSAHRPHSGPMKRPRPDDLDLSGIPDLDQGDLDMQQTPLAYGPPGSQPTHHHHRLPETGPPTKMMRRDDTSGGAPSVVGQAGMPAPALRPRGPKLKFTPEDDQLLIDLKENKNLTWKQIADFFPGRSSGTLQVRYCTKLKAKTTQWTEETDQKLRNALQDYENEKWRIVANKQSMSPVGAPASASGHPGDTTANSSVYGHQPQQSQQQQHQPLSITVPVGGGPGEEPVSAVSAVSVSVYGQPPPQPPHPSQM